MALEDVEVTPLDPERFRDVLSPEGLAQFEDAMARGRELLDGRTLWNVNSTAHGGGVAEMLRSLIGYVRGVGVDARWIIIEGDPEFFQVTKRLHNRLHGYAGDGGPLGEAERAVYERVAAEHADLLAQRVAPRDVVILHDPQTAGMVSRWSRQRRAGHLARAHRPRRAERARARGLALPPPYVEPADAYVFSRRSYTWEGLDRAEVVGHPAVDRRLLAEEPGDVVQRR